MIKINAPADAPKLRTVAATPLDTDAAPIPPPLPTLSRPPSQPALPLSFPHATSLLSLAAACHTHVNDVGDGPLTTTTICPFHNITQHTASSPPSHHSLGVWADWSDAPQSLELLQRYDDGDACGDGASGGVRSAELHVRCHETASVAAVVELRRCQYRVVLDTPAACPHLPRAQPIRAEIRLGGEAQTAAKAADAAGTVDVSDMQACIEHLSETAESGRSTASCAVRWNALRDALSEAPREQAANIVEVNRKPYPYKHKQLRSGATINSGKT